VVARRRRLTRAVATSEAPLRRTPLYDEHMALGGRLIDFAGWELPVQYAGIVEEHRAVRGTAGLFDLSHMGEVWVDGPRAGDALAYALVSDPRSLDVGRAQYSLICQADGGVIDDLIVYRAGIQRYLVVPNASNASTVAAELSERAAGFEARVDDASARTALIAIQGPRALELLAPLVDAPIGDLHTYALLEGRVAGVGAWVARTGYTGEDGFELFVAAEDAVAVWRALLAAAPEGALRPAGLGARDTLRLEAGMPLYGNELDRDTRPDEARLGRVVKLDKPGGFVGREALAAARAAGPRKLLAGLVLREPGIARHGYPLLAGIDTTHPVGVVTSGSHAPTLGVAVAMGYLPPSLADPGTMVRVGVRSSTPAAEVVELPFYRRPRTGA
jgi:aminomethyltransferase